MAAPLTPVERSALLAAYSAPEHTLVRARTGFYPANAPARVFTRRAVNFLDRRALITFDDPDIPRKASLTAAGVRQAEQLLESAREKLVAEVAAR